MVLALAALYSLYQHHRQQQQQEQEQQDQQVRISANNTKEEEEEEQGEDEQQYELRGTERRDEEEAKYHHPLRHRPPLGADLHQLEHEKLQAGAGWRDQIDRLTKTAKESGSELYQATTVLCGRPADPAAGVRDHRHKVVERTRVVVDRLRKDHQQQRQQQTTKMMSGSNSDATEITPKTYRRRRQPISMPDSSSAPPCSSVAQSPNSVVSAGASTGTTPVVVKTPYHVRKEWIDAVFGPSFLVNEDPSQPIVVPKQGMGLACIPSYMTITTSISLSSDGCGGGGASSSQQAALCSPKKISSSPGREDAPGGGSAPDPESDKLGLIIHRLPLGVYVRHVEAGSEAEAAGIVPGSVLVDINGMAFLAEPTKQALERIWQYEGHFDESIYAVNDAIDRTPGTLDADPMVNSRTMPVRGALPVPLSSSSSLDAAAAHQPTQVSVVVRDPVALTFIHGGSLYTSFIVSTPPWGISWAPVGNFPLVKRAYSHAARAGVPRGSLVAAVDRYTFRDMDHTEAAAALRVAFMQCQDNDNNNYSDDPIRLILAFPPAAARTANYERRLHHNAGFVGVDTPGGRSNVASSASPQPSASKTTTNRRRSVPFAKVSHNGVDVKFHPLDQKILGSLFQVGGFKKGHLNRVTTMKTGRSYSGPGSMQDWAEKVAAGMVEAPSRRFRRARGYRHRNHHSSVSPPSSTSSATTSTSRLYGPCPAIEPGRILQLWEPLEALVNCLQYHRHQTNTSVSSGTEQFSAITHARKRRATVDDHLETIREIISGPRGAEMASAFLLQCMSLICSPDPAASGPQERTGIQEEKKMADGESGHVTAPATRKIANELTMMLLRLSRRDEGFCQRLYFLLRSYISTFETRRRPISSCSSTKSEDDSRNLMAILQCLELLRFAEKELAGRTPTPLTPPESTPRPPTSTAAAYMLAQQQSRVRSGLSVGESSAAESSRVSESSSVPSALAASPCSPTHVNDQGGRSADKARGLISGLFCKRPKELTTQTAEYRQPSPFPAVHSSPTKRTQSMRSTPLRPPLSHVPEASGGNTKVSLTSTASSGDSERQKAHFSLSQSPSAVYENMSDFLSELDRICGTIERSLQKSFRQKIAEWAMQPWSASKDTALALVTENMRESLRQAQESTTSQSPMLLVNPVDSAELLSSVDYNDCFILPSAHFPILITFNVSERRCSDFIAGEEKLYRTKVQFLSLHGKLPFDNPESTFVVHGAVAGAVMVTGPSSASDDATSGDVSSIVSKPNSHQWTEANTLVFETRSSWGAPRTLSIRLSASPTASLSDAMGKGSQGAGVGYGWVDLSQQWRHYEERRKAVTTTHCAEVWQLSNMDGMFDDCGHRLQGDEISQERLDQRLEAIMIVTTEQIEFDEEAGGHSRKRLLLYKHDDDLRQEAFAVQFIQRCDDMLKASGLEMKILTFQCIPVGVRRGFVEWVPGCAPMSEICRPFAGSILASNSQSKRGGHEDGNSPSMLAKAGLTKYESLRRLGGQQFESLCRTGTPSSSFSMGVPTNPIQDYLRSVAYDPRAPYLIDSCVMDTFVKSCAGYSVISYILGIGDRHLDNLLLHQNGSFFHCDFSFILGSDPKTYLPMRITEEMVLGMGGRDSDNYAKFLSLMGASFVALRRPENVRVLLSMVRLLEASYLPDVSENQTLEQATFGVRDRLRLDLTDEMAVSYMENLVEASLSNKLWIAVDAIHSLGKKF